jgi:hypothetical protein
MNLRFAHPWLLYLLWLVPLIGIWWSLAERRRQQRISQFVSLFMQARLQPAASTARFHWQAALIMGGFFLLLLAAARPQWGMREETVYTRGRDLIIALDVSRSMLANDVHPNRLRRAKADILDIIKELRGDRAGLLAFRHKAVLLCPLTTDYAYLRHALENATPDSVPPGETDIGDAILKALEAFEDGEGSHKAIVLISDGEDLQGKALDAARQAGEQGVPIFSVGLGNRKGSKIPGTEGETRYAQFQGKDIVTKLNHGTLLEIAKATPGGAYIPVETASTASTTLGTLYRSHLRNVSARDVEEALMRRHIERYQYFLLPGLLLLLGGAFLSRGRLSTNRRKAARRPAPASPTVTATAGTADRAEPPQPPPLKDLTPPRTELRSLGVLLIVGLLAQCITAQTNPPAAVPDEPAPTQEPLPTPETPSKHPPGRRGARMAQKLYSRGKHAEAAEVYLQASQGATHKSQEDFRYNAAIANLKAGNHDEAARLFGEQSLHPNEERRIAASIGMGAALWRSAELPDQPTVTNLNDRAELLEKAGEAFKNGLRTVPGDPQARDNLQAVLNALPEAEEQAKIATLMAKYEQVPIPQIADEMLRNQRELAKHIPAAFSNDSPTQIGELEALAGRQNDNADLWIPLRGKLLSAMSQQQGATNAQQQIALFEQMAATSLESMRGAHALLRDINTHGKGAAAAAEDTVYPVWKAVASFDGLLREDIRRQTNAVLSATATDPTDALLQKTAREQAESLQLTQLFGERFAQSVPEEGLPAAAPPQGQATPETAQTNQPPQLSAEDRQKILELTEEAKAEQQAALENLAKGGISSSLPHQRRSHELLEEIAELMPKQQSQSQQQQPQQQPQQQDQQDQQQDPQDPQQDPQQQQEQPDQPQEQPEEKETPEDVRRLLEKALQREEEHEDEKRRRMHRLQVSPRDRDW